MQGSPVVYQAIIKLPPQTTADWTFTVTADTDMHVCAVYIKEYGYGVPCLDRTRDGVRTKRVGTFYDESIVFSLPKLTNVGKLSCTDYYCYIVVETGLGVIKILKLGLKPKSPNLRLEAA